MTVAEAAARLEVSESLIYKLCAGGRLAHHRIGLGRGAIRIDPEDVARLRAETRREARPEASAAAAPPRRPAPSGRLDGQPLRFVKIRGPKKADRPPRRTE